MSDETASVDGALVDALTSVYRSAQTIEDGLNTLKSISELEPQRRPMMCGLEMNLADAVGDLHDLLGSPAIGRPEGGTFPRSIKRALGGLTSQLSEWVERWGWQGVLGTDRKQFLRSRRDQHAKIDEQFHRVMLTLRSRNDVPFDPNGDEIADKAERRGLTPDATLSDKTTNELFEMARRLNASRWDDPVISGTRPSFSPEELTAFHWNAIEIARCVDKMKPDQLSHLVSSQETSGATPPDVPFGEQASNSPVFIPSVDQLLEIHQALWNFILKGRSRSLVTWKEEDDYLPVFVRLADALRPVRPLVDSVEGWSPRVRRAFLATARGFDATSDAWEWGPLIEPEPARSAYVEGRKAWFREEVERPMYEAALSWQDGCTSSICPVDEVAEEGRRWFKPTMSAEEGEARFPEAQQRWLTTPRFGARKPEVERQVENDLNIACNMLGDVLKPLVPDRIAHPDSGKPEVPEVAVELAPSVFIEPGWSFNAGDPMSGQGLPSMTRSIVPTHSQLAELVVHLHAYETAGRACLDGHSDDGGFNVTIPLNQAGEDCQRLLGSRNFRWPSGWPAEVRGLLKHLCDYFNARRFNSDREAVERRLDELNGLIQQLDCTLDACFPRSSEATESNQLGEPQVESTPDVGKAIQRQQPARKAFLAYSLNVLSGFDQTTTARKLRDEHKIPATQGQVSRWVNVVNKWLGAGNTLPVEWNKPKSIPTDPSKLDKGYANEKYARRKPLF